MPYSTIDYHDLRGWRRFYARIAPALVIFCLCASLFASVGTFAVQQAQEADRDARVQETRVLLDCFNRYASASASTSKAVRTAVVRVDQARVRRDRALQLLFDQIVTNPPEGDPTTARIFTRVLETNRALVTSQQQLDRVRRQNPVPDPPSTFCELP